MIYEFPPHKLTLNVLYFLFWALLQPTRAVPKALITHVVCQHSRVRREAWNADGHVVVDFEDLLPESQAAADGWDGRDGRDGAVFCGEKNQNIFDEIQRDNMSYAG